jgi:hypothetical protein
MESLRNHVRWPLEPIEVVERLKILGPEEATWFKWQARYSLARSERVAQVADSSLWKLVYTKIEILPMTLDKTQIFIAGLLSQWITKRTTVTTKSSKQAAP